MIIVSLMSYFTNLRVSDVLCVDSHVDMILNFGLSLTLFEMFFRIFVHFYALLYCSVLSLILTAH